MASQLITFQHGNQEILSYSTEGPPERVAVPFLTIRLHDSTGSGLDKVINQLVNLENEGIPGALQLSIQNATDHDDPLFHKFVYEWNLARVLDVYRPFPLRIVLQDDTGREYPADEYMNQIGNQIQAIGQISISLSRVV